MSVSFKRLLGLTVLEVFKGLLGMVCLLLFIYVGVKLLERAFFEKVPESRESIAERVCRPGLSKLGCDAQVSIEEKKIRKAIYCRKKLKELAEECATAGDIDRCVTIKAEKFGIKNGYITFVDYPDTRTQPCN